MVSVAGFRRELAMLDEKRTATVPRRVAAILAEVGRDGDAALRRLTGRFDGVALRRFRVPQARLGKAWRSLSPGLRAALRMAASNITAYQSGLLPPRDFVARPRRGVRVTTRWTPLERVGCYAPGGRAAYPSTVLMTCLPARVAGVRQVFVASPPGRDGLPSRLVMAAAHLARASGVFAIGGAQALAAFAYGTETVPRVDKIVGPGNAYVAEAKRQLVGTVGIDAIAGPTELAIWADDGSDPEWIAADLSAQAEHDPAARPILFASSSRLASAVLRRLGAMAKDWPRDSAAAQSLRSHGRVVVARETETAIGLINDLAPEHVQVWGKEPERRASEITRAGTVFLGPLTPAPLGDYTTGANHVLPTGRTARWSSPLSVYDFLRLDVRQKVNRAGVESIGPAAATIADAEGLPLHAQAIRRRLA